MKYQRLAAIVLACTATVSLLAMYEVHFGGRPAVAYKRANIFRSEYAAAYEGALNREPNPPVPSIDSGEQITVIWDAYGKDYWACYVRTSKGLRGWALCTSLKMKA